MRNLFSEFEIEKGFRNLRESLFAYTLLLLVLACRCFCETFVVFVAGITAYSRLFFGFVLYGQTLFFSSEVGERDAHHKLYD